MVGFVESIFWITLMIIVVVYVARHYSKSRENTSTIFELFQESMTKIDNPPKVVLFGDSILNNSRYVPFGKSVGASLQDIYGAGFKTYAQDGALIHTVYNQVEQYGIYNDSSGEASNDNTHIVISVGGNDMLNALNVHALSDEKVDKFASQYESLIKHICTTFPYAYVYLLNVYHPKEERYQKITKYIDKWNESVSELIETDELKRVTLVDVDSVVVKEEDFVSEVEPSSKGGKKIAKAVVSKINEYL